MGDTRFGDAEILVVFPVLTSEKLWFIGRSVFSKGGFNRSIMGFFDKLSRSVSNQVDQIRTYWSDPSINFAQKLISKPLYATSNWMKEKVQGRSPILQATVGSTMAAVRLLGEVPVGIYDWGSQVVEELPHGPQKTFFTFLEVPIKGMIKGADFFCTHLEQWGKGGLAKKNSYEIAEEITLTLGTGLLLFLGGRGAVRGASQIGKGMAGGLGFNANSPKLAKAVVMSDVALIKTGAAQATAGIMLMEANLPEKASTNSSPEKAPTEPRYDTEPEVAVERADTFHSIVTNDILNQTAKETPAVFSQPVMTITKPVSPVVSRGTVARFLDMDTIVNSLAETINQNPKAATGELHTLRQFAQTHPGAKKRILELEATGKIER